MLDNLLTHNAARTNRERCDICKRKGINEEAVIYCITCCNKYCTEHRKVSEWAYALASWQFSSFVTFIACDEVVFFACKSKLLQLNFLYRRLNYTSGIEI